MPDPSYEEPRRSGSETKAPLPVLNGIQRPTTLASVIHHLQKRHVVRDTLFMLLVAIVGFFFVVFLSTRIFPQYDFWVFVGTYWLLGMIGYLMVATWGRQSQRIRTFRLLWDMIAVGILIGGYMLYYDATVAIILVIANLLASAIGLAISFKAAPYIPDTLFNDSQQIPGSIEK